MSDLLSYISQASGLTSILTLFWASIDVPFHEASWTGETRREKRHRRKGTDNIRVEMHSKGRLSALAWR